MLVSLTLHFLRQLHNLFAKDKYFRSFYRTGKVLHSTYVYQKPTLP